MVDWKQAALQRLIDDGIRERHDLEYKAAEALAKTDGKKKEITIDVSAMANSGGGTIIFGMAEDDLHRAEAIDPVDPWQYPKQWLEQVVDLIEPRIPEVSIQRVEIAGTTRIVYVVGIPQSVTAHQAVDNRYYRRHEDGTLQMRHHEIVDVMNRAKLPNLELLVGYKTEGREGTRHDYMLTLKVTNSASVTASHYKLEITFPHSAFNPRADSVYADVTSTWHDPVMLSRREEGDVVTITYRSRRPLYPKDTDDITNDIMLRYSMDEEAQRVVGENAPDVSWVIHADNTLPKTGRAKMRDLENC
jgi:hypothetical protein